jgi:hypothetical protein
MPPGWPTCGPPAGAAGLAWVRAGPAEARSASPRSADRKPTFSPAGQRKAGNVRSQDAAESLPALRRPPGTPGAPIDRFTVHAASGACFAGFSGMGSSLRSCVASGHPAEVTGATTALAVMCALCQSPLRNPGPTQAQGPSFPTGPPTTPPLLPSCGWLRPTRSSNCAAARLAAVITASPAVECRPTRPVRADPPLKTIRTTTTTGTTTINPAEGPVTG